MTKRLLASLAIVVIIAVGLILGGGTVRAAACAVPSIPYPTIQDAVNDPSCDPIVVAPGTYLEPAPGPLTISRPVTLRGAQAGVDARFPRGAESIINDLQGTSVAASDVVIDGFTVQNSLASFPGFGIWINPGRSGTRILNDIIQNNIVGIGLANQTTQALIQHNLIRNNNAAGAASGTGIYTDEFVGGPVLRNVLIRENAFIGNIDAGIDSSNTDPAGGVFNVDVLANSFDMNGRAVVLFNTHDWSIADNRIGNNTLAASAAIRIFDNNTNLSIVGNDLVNGVGHAIRLSNLGIVGGPSSGVEIHQNNIGLVGSANFALNGLLVDLLPPGHVGTVGADCNWWGSSTGPLNVPNNPSGTGEEVVGDADFTPWLTAPAPGGPCIGGLASTPGKVTGGGHITGEPVFDGGGLLLSLPALVVSASSPNEKATFGFVAKCCPASGNLSYHDHAADVRIKATSIDFLQITSPGTFCPSTPGSKHAMFTGTAEVTRSSGTLTESLTVNVDDCGEPGTADTLGIETDSYSNGPKTLTGGNIQIH